MLQSVDDPSVKARLTTWIVDQHNLGIDCPEISSTILDEMKVAPSLDVRRRADRLLEFLEAAIPMIGQPLKFSYREGDAYPEMLAWTESTRAEEIRFLLKFLDQTGAIQLTEVIGGGSVYIAMDGYARLADIKKKEIASEQAFIAMWFSEETLAVRNAIKNGILNAGYTPRVIDELHHNNKIDDEIIAEIRRSRFLVADFTHGEAGMRGGVYYEAGFARGLGMEVISTCRADLLAENKIHFDTRQYNHIGWHPEKLDEFTKALSDRISATIGDGPRKTES
ncbi:MAG: hypothetical protein CMI62_09415 [Parvibaculum sp.]|nr:hypothetical protein [Parvibaculum sp.]|tara:strand:- start:135 stop:974 length:840 start_codon:yes stop_codon:yes gene_type:complete